MLKKITLIGATAISAFAMHTAEVNINDKDLALSAQFDMGQFNQNVKPDTIFVGAKFLKCDDKTSNNSRNPYYELNFLMQQKLANQNIALGMGVKANYIQDDIGKQDYISVPLGLEFKMKIPLKDIVPMYFHMAAYYAPEVLCANDGKNFIEYRANYDVEIIKNGKVTVGYRQLHTDYIAGDYLYNNSWYVGFKFSF